MLLELEHLETQNNKGFYFGKFKTINTKGLIFEKDLKTFLIGYQIF